MSRSETKPEGSERNTVDLAHGARNMLDGAAVILESMVQKTRYVGLGNLSDKLAALLQQVERGTEKLYKAWEEEFFAHNRTVQERGPLLLQAALAGIEQGRGERTGGKEEASS